MKKFIYRHSFLFELLAVVPAVIFAEWLFRATAVGGFAFILLAVWTFAVMTYASSRVPALLYREAGNKLEYRCDPEAYLADIQFMLSRPTLSRARRFHLQMARANGIDACGRYIEALAELQKLEEHIDEAGLSDKIFFRANYITVALHAGRETERIPQLLGELEGSIVHAQLPPPIADGFRAHLVTLRDAYRFVCGEYHGLRERYVDAVAALQKGKSTPRILCSACMRLARLYDRLGLSEEACGLYRYVAEKGNRLGIAAQAKERLATLA